eukprot:scaffold77144_cov17-Tisochrysis_lutea.AAC.1
MEMCCNGAHVHMVHFRMSSWGKVDEQAAAAALAYLTFAVRVLQFTSKFKCLQYFCFIRLYSMILKVFTSGRPIGLICPCVGFVERVSPRKNYTCCPEGTACL